MTTDIQPTPEVLPDVPVVPPVVTPEPVVVPVEQVVGYSDALRSRVTSNSSPEVIAQQQKAWELKASGKTTTQICKEMGIFRARLGVLLKPFVEILPDPVVVAAVSEKERLIELLAEKKKLLELRKKALAQYEAVFPYLGFVPHPGQWDFLKLVEQGQKDGVMKYGCFCGNGWGKSYLLANLAWNCLNGGNEKNPFFNMGFLTDWKYPKHIRLVCNAKNLKQPAGELWKAIDRWWPKSEYTAMKQGYDYDSVYQHKRTGMVLDIMTHDQPAMLHESATLGMVIFDEPPPQSIWEAYPARLRHGGLMLLFATLVFESYWIKENIIDEPACRTTFGDIEQNCSQCSIREVEIGGRTYKLRGHLDHKNIETMIANFPAHEREARRTGKPVHLSGRAFAYDEAVHVIQELPVEEKKPFVQSILVLDPHQRRPWAMIVSQRDEHGNEEIVDEWPRVNTSPWKLPYHRITLDQTGLDEYAGIIKDLKRKWSVSDRNCVIDSKFASQYIKLSADAQKLLETLMYTYKLRFVPGNTQVRGEGGGIRELQAALTYDREKPVNFLNRPRLRVRSNCWNTRYQLENVTWDEKADPDQYGMKEVLIEKLLDFPRLIMYLLMHRAAPFRTPPDKETVQKQTLDEVWKKVSRDFQPQQPTLTGATSFQDLVEYV